MVAIRQERRKREVEHIERMRALELGRTLPQDEPWWSPPRIALSIGAAVPLGVFFLVFLSSLVVGYHEPMWLAACIVGVAGVISGSVLAYHSFDARALATGPGMLKPPVEEDAYDVVASRG
jgi:hypothetical protein